MSFNFSGTPNPLLFRQQEQLTENIEEEIPVPESQEVSPIEQEDVFSQRAKERQTQKEETDIFSQRSQARDKKESEKQQSILEKFGKALSYQARSNVVEDIRTITPILSGATFGASEKIPGFEIPEEYPEEYTSFMKTVGSVAPIEGLFFLNKPLRLLAEKSPILKRSLSSLASIIQSGLVGAEYETISHIVESGELPDPDDVLAHGAEWAAIDTALRATGAAGRFGKDLIFKSKTSGVGPFRIINDIAEDLQNKNIDLTNLEKVSEAAENVLQELDLPKAQRKIELHEKPTKIEEAVKDIFEDHPVTAKNLENKKVNEEFFDRIENVDYKEPSKPIVEDAKELEKNIAKEVSKDEIDQFHPREETDQEVGRDIKRKVNEKFTKAKEEYDALYEGARDRMENLSTETTPIADKIEEGLNRLERIKTKPEGYAKVINTLKTSLEDIGFPFKLDEETGRIIFERGTLAEVPLSNLTELGVRLGEIVDFNVIEPSIKDALKPVRAEIKKVIRDTLKDKDIIAEKLWKLAEQKYGETANKFGKPSIVKIRKQHYAEEIPQEVTRATTVDDLKEILGNEYKAVEREILEDIRKIDLSKASKTYNEMRKKLSPKADNIAKDILKRKKTPKIGTPKQLELAIAEALSKPRRPKTLIDYWKTAEGNARMRGALRKNPNRDQIIQYFQKQALHDFGNQFLDSGGRINFGNFEKALKKQSNIRIIRDIGGQDAVNFFKQIAGNRKRISDHVKMFENRIKKDHQAYRTKQEFVKRAKENIQKARSPKEAKLARERLNSREKELQRLNNSIKKEYGDQYGGILLQRMARKEFPYFFKVEDLFKQIGVPGKVILGLSGILKFGLLKGTGAGIALPYLGKLLYKVMKNRAIRNRLKRLAAIREPSSFIKILQDFSRDMDEEIEEDE